MKSLIPIFVIFALTSCSGLRPVTDDSRYFVLAPQPMDDRNSTPAVGVGRIKMPDYLKSKGIVTRRGENEIQYSDRFIWAESLEKSLERLIASELSATNAFPGAWRREQVRAEVYISIERFEIDESGGATLAAHWRIVGPGSGPILYSGSSRISKPSPPLNVDPNTAALRLSDCVADLVREIRAALQRLPNLEEKP